MGRKVFVITTINSFDGDLMVIQQFTKTELKVYFYVVNFKVDFGKRIIRKCFKPQLLFCIFHEASTLVSINSAALKFRGIYLVTLLKDILIMKLPKYLKFSPSQIKIRSVSCCSGGTKNDQKNLPYEDFGIYGKKWPERKGQRAKAIFSSISQS